MSVTPLARNWWRLPGCGETCQRSAHDPYEHEQHGRLLEREARQQRIVKTGPLVVDLEHCTATVHGAEVRLSPREWELLAFYAERAGRWCSNDEVIAAIWGYAASDATATIRWRLRSRLGDAAGMLETQTTQSGWGRLTRLRMVEPES